MIGQLTNRVLLVDDEPLMRKLISRYLVAAGYVVRAAEDGLDAIGKLRAGLPDLIISDLKMPRMSGVEFLNAVRIRFPQIPVIAISSMAGDQMPAGLAADAYYYKNASGFEQLLDIMSDLAKKPPQRAAPLRVDSKPVQATRCNEGTYLICCDDCLRTFSVPPSFGKGKDKMWINCLHCGKVVQFLVADQESAL